MWWAPNLKASDNEPNRLTNSSLEYPAISKALIIMSSLWFLIAPEDNSTPLQTISNCQAKISNGFLLFKDSILPVALRKDCD